MLQKISAAFSLFAILAITIFSASNAYAQVSGANLSGTITDPSGAAIAEIEGASISVDLARRDFTVNAIAVDLEKVAPGLNLVVDYQHNCLMVWNCPHVVIQLAANGNRIVKTAPPLGAFRASTCPPCASPRRVNWWQRRPVSTLSFLDFQAWQHSCR
jgi:hypothetical protein